MGGGKAPKEFLEKDKREEIESGTQKTLFKEKSCDHEFYGTQIAGVTECRRCGEVLDLRGDQK